MTKIAFLMDPIHALSLKKDSTLAMIAAAQRRGLEVFYLNQADLLMHQGQVMALVKTLELRADFCQSLDASSAGDDWYELGSEQSVALADFDIVMMRKDPPFDMEYIYTTYLLERAEAQGALVVNRPSALRDCNEKLFATQFPQCCPELIVSRRIDQLKTFHNKHRNVVFKKLDGMGGASIFRIMDEDPNLSVVLETLTDGEREQIMGQVYLPQIVDGDKRILLINGEPVPYTLARIPSAGETRGNLAAGGRGEGRPLTDRDRWIAEQVGPELKRRGLLFVGIDVIGEHLTEINVTCPTCIRELDEQFGLDIAGDLIDTCLKQLAARMA
ncbi:MAG: glutathione synthase [Gammaproteobacteria bacterium TMED92]|nr:MAG: glutathione synthase [Gammaproteobacteria bacterium TMED92]